MKKKKTKEGEIEGGGKRRRRRRRKTRRINSIGFFRISLCVKAFPFFRRIITFNANFFLLLIK